MLGRSVESIGCLEPFEPALCCCTRSPSEQVGRFHFRKRLEILHCFKVLLEDLHAVDSSYHSRSWQAHRVVETLDRSHGLTVKDQAVAHRFHAQHTYAFLDQ